MVLLVVAYSVDHVTRRKVLIMQCLCYLVVLFVVVYTVVCCLHSVVCTQCLCFRDVVQVLTHEDCRTDRVLWELKLVERSEVVLKEKQM